MDDTNELGCWISVKLAKESFLVSIDHVVELTRLTDHAVADLPQSPPAVLGTLELRQQLVPLVDLRVMLGFRSMESETQEVIDLLGAREQDHVNWLNELEASVCEARQFTLTTDPHACKFGRWYDALMGDQAALDAFTNRNLSLRSVLEAFDSPHQQIHALAIRVGDLVEAGKSEDALTLIETTRSTVLSSMIRLFSQARDQVRELRQPLVMVVDRDGVRAGFLIDEVNAINQLKPEVFEPIPEGLNRTAFATGVFPGDASWPMHLVLSATALLARATGAGFDQELAPADAPLTIAA